MAHFDAICDITGLYEAKPKNFVLIGLFLLMDMSCWAIYSMILVIQMADWEVVMRDGHLNTFYVFISLSAFIPICPP